MVEVPFDALISQFGMGVVVVPVSIAAISGFDVPLESRHWPQLRIFKEKIKDQSLCLAVPLFSKDVMVQTPYFWIQHRLFKCLL